MVPERRHHPVSIGRWRIERDKAIDDANLEMNILGSVESLEPPFNGGEDARTTGWKEI